MTSNISNKIAIIAMSCRLPGADNEEQFYSNIYSERCSIKEISQDEISTSSYGHHQIDKESYVPYKGYLRGVEYFDAEFFNLSKRDAQILDPQYRLFLESSWECFERSGYIPGEYEGKVGVFVGSSEIDTYLMHHLYGREMDPSQVYSMYTRNTKDALPSLIAQKLNLRGPTMSVQAACATSLVAIDTAIKSLLTYESDMALAGAVSITMPVKSGYHYTPGMILSKDGKCCAFDKHATGTVPGNGLGVILLKRLEDALDQQDYIHAVIEGSATENSGARSPYYTMPSVEAAIEVMNLAIERSGIELSRLSHIEAHATGTYLGDTIEMAAINEVINEHGRLNKKISIGSLKPNIGHLVEASGIAAIIKSIGILNNQKVPLNINLNTLNPDISNELVHFPAQASSVDDKQVIDCVGVAAYGIGGYNSFLIMSRYQRKEAIPSTSKKKYLFVVSAKSKDALNLYLIKLKCYLQAHKNIQLKDIAYTLQCGRNQFKYRYSMICDNYDDLLNGLKGDVLPNQKESSNLEKLRDRWMMGETINWKKEMEPLKGKKIPLPSHPFIREKYWIEPIKNKSSIKKNNNVTYNIEAIQNDVEAIFKQYLNYTDLDPIKYFTDMGGDSLLSLQISNALVSKYNIFKDMDVFINYASLNELYDDIEKRIKRDS